MGGPGRVPRGPQEGSQKESGPGKGCESKDRCSLFLRKKKKIRNKVVTKPQARSNCDVTNFRSDMGTDGPTKGRTSEPTNIVSYRGATSRLKIKHMSLCKNEENQNGDRQK
jgi:hypothetical protein